MDEQKIYDIPECNLPDLETKINKLNKKAAKLHCQPIVITKIGQYDKKVKSELNNNNYEYIRYIQLTITGTAPIIAGYELIASCEQKEKGTLIKSVPNKEYPSHYRELMICEHCNSNRYRKFTFIVRNVITNEYKMVGKSCLKDFLGHVDPNFYAEYLQWIADAELSEYNEPMGHYESRFETKEYLNFVTACIREKGWTSRTVARESEGEKNATADYALTSLQAHYKPIRDRFGNIIPFPEPTEQDEELTQKAIEWAQNITDLKNDYLYNINLLSYEQTIKYNDMGFAASIVSSYIKSVQKEIEKEKKATLSKQNAISDYIGNIGDKIQLELTYLKSFSYDTEYGTTWIHKFMDNNGNILIWKTNKTLGYWTNDEYKYIENGENVKLKGSIKAHNEYNNEKQTILTRCKMI